MLRPSLLALSFTLVAASHAAVLWDEGLQGDLIGDHLNPQQVSVSTGSNLLIGSTGFSDRDYFTFSLAPGQSLTSITVVGYVSDDPVSFLAVQEGTFITEDPEAANVGNLLGWTFFGTPQLGMDILPSMGTGGGAIGFTPPLSGPNYAFWLQQTGDPTTYVLDFQVVPEPTTLAVLGCGLLWGLRKRSRR